MAKDLTAARSRFAARDRPSRQASPRRRQAGAGRRARQNVARARDFPQEPNIKCSSQEKEGLFREGGEKTVPFSAHCQTQRSGVKPRRGARASKTNARGRTGAAPPLRPTCVRVVCAAACSKFLPLPSFPPFPPGTILRHVESSRHDAASFTTPRTPRRKQHPAELILTAAVVSTCRRQGHCLALLCPTRSQPLPTTCSCPPPLLSLLFLDLCRPRGKGTGGGLLPGSSWAPARRRSSGGVALPRKKRGSPPTGGERAASKQASRPVPRGERP